MRERTQHSALRHLRGRARPWRGRERAAFRGVRAPSSAQRRSHRYRGNGGARCGPLAPIARRRARPRSARPAAEHRLRLQVRPALDVDLSDVQRVRRQAEGVVDGTLGPYVQLKNALAEAVGKRLWWVRDITLSNTMWGNRAPNLDHPRAGVHALGGGIGQGLAMGVGVAVANAEHGLGRKTVSLCGDGGFMLNLGELACAAQERADVVFIVMNDQRYGVIKNIQDDIYGSRHCYVELHNPDFSKFCSSLAVPHFKLSDPAQSSAVFQQAFAQSGPVVVEVDMNAWGPFAAKFAGPILKKD